MCFTCELLKLYQNGAFPANSRGVLQSAALSVPSAAPQPSHPSSELCCAGHWTHLRSLLTSKTACHPKIQSAGSTYTLFTVYVYIYYEKWLLNFCVVEVHLVALPSVKGHILCFFDGFTHQSVATDKVHSFSQLVCTHSSINLYHIHQHLGTRHRPQPLIQRTHLGHNV